MHDIFNDSAESTGDLTQDVRDYADKAYYITYAARGIATCLLASLKDTDAGYPQALIDTIAPDLLRRAKELVPLVLHEELEGGCTEDDKAHLSPDRAWPLMLCHALFEAFDCDGDGAVEGWRGHILNDEEDDNFPTLLRVKQIDVAEAVHDDLTQFTLVGTEILKQRLNYPCEMDPLWFWGVVQLAGENDIEYSKGLDEWFFPCFDVLLADVHEARAQSGDLSYKRHYH